MILNLVTTMEKMVTACLVILITIEKWMYREMQNAQMIIVPELLEQIWWTSSVTSILHSKDKDETMAKPYKRCVGSVIITTANDNM